MKDLIIIGASAAGTGAAIYASRRKLDFFIISEDIGGEVATSGEIGNWPGIVQTTGIQLADDFRKHLEALDVEIQQGWRVEKLEHKENHHVVHAKKGRETVQFETKAVLIASGIHPRHLEVPGEAALYGKGVTYCTVCDGPLFKGKTTATVGGGNSALESALMMSDIASKVFVVNVNPEFKGEQVLIDKLKEKTNVELIMQAATTEIVGDTKVTGLKYNDTAGAEHSIAVDGVMVHIGQIPNSSFVDSIEKNKFGEIVVDKKGATSVPGVFAAGDVTDIPHKQIVIAAGQGVCAVLTAIEYLNRFSER